jgi:hypothetical protein
MKKYLVLSAAAVAMLASPAFAQSNDRGMQTQSDVLEGARQSSEGGIGSMYEGRSSAVGGSTNSGNLETREDVQRGAEESTVPGAPGEAPASSLQGGSESGGGSMIR